MISDVLSDAVSEIEEYLRDTPNYVYQRSLPCRASGRRRPDEQVGSASLVSTSGEVLANP